MKRKLKYIAFTLFTVYTLQVNAQTRAEHYNDRDFSVDYTLSNGMLNGHSTVYYKNGKKKAEGNFSYNERVGEWVGYDSTGKVAVKRFYKNNIEYALEYPVCSDGPAKLLSGPIDKVERGPDGCYKYFFIQERQVIFSKRTWSYILNKDNPLLGNNNRLFKVLYSQILKHGIRAYKAGKDLDKTFRDSVDFSATPLDTSKVKVIGFLTKEDWFYDIDRGLLDCRILGLCPLVTMKSSAIDSTDTNGKFLKANVAATNKDTIGLFWVYYPQARKWLAKEKVNASADNLVENMDDIFFWKYLAWHIHYEISETGARNVENGWGTLMMIYNLEHDIWLGDTHREIYYESSLGE